MAISVDIGTLINPSNPVRQGRPTIAGTGMTVKCVAIWNMMGETPEEIAASYPHISLAQVYAALSYYHANREAIDADIAADEAAYDAHAPVPQS